MKNYILLTILFIFNSAFASVKSDSIKTITAYRLEKPLVLDGILDEPVYSKLPLTEFTQRDPLEGKPATEKSEVWIFYDDFNIYFSGRFYDSHPDSIDATLMRRDNHVESDWFWIYLDPYNDDRTGNYFAVNAAGSICDGTLYNDSWDDNSWDGIWENKTRIEKDGWTVEVKIPFTQLRFKESEHMTWGVNLNRDIKRKHEMSFYVMVPKAQSGYVSHFADLVGLDGIKPKQRFEILPYAVQKAQYLVHDSNDPFYKSNQYNTSLGADLKFSLGSNLNVDATFNPDFGQVEVDPAIVNLSAFETFYDEKRSFFIEGANIFQFGFGGANNNWGFNFGIPELFYSRRIGRTPQGNITNSGYVDFPSETRILGAAKLSGKIDESWSIGVLSSVTERTFASVQTADGNKIEEQVEPLTHYSVFRTQKEFNTGKQALGFILTSVNRDLSDENLKKILSKQAYTFGADGWTFLDDDETYVVTGSVIGSYTSGTKDYLIKLQQQPYRYFQRPDKTYMHLDSNRTSLSGIFSRVMINKQKGNFYLNAALGTISPGFEYNDLGSQWFADRINGHLVLGYRWYEPAGILRSKGIYLAYNKSTDYEGNINRDGFYMSAKAEFTNYWGIGISSSYNFKGNSTTLTRGGPTLDIPQNYSFSLNAYTDSRDKIIFSPYVNLWWNKIGSNEQYYYGFEVVWKPNSQISLTFSPEYDYNFASYQWVGNFSDSYAINTYKTRYVFGDLNQKTISANIRLNWIFTPTLSLQVYIQPLISVGDYKNFKEIANPPSLDFRKYGTENSEITYEERSSTYIVDPDGNGAAAQFSFSNPDFNFKSLRGNLVLRWEALPGSVFYFAWTNSRMNFENHGVLNFKNDFTNLINSESNNVFLVKFSYWFNL